MQIIPAIDIRGGHCVRLRQGNYDQETQFGDDPAAWAERWVAEGAERIHLVDLDGAVAGRVVNFETVLEILERVTVPVQLGGGIRDDDTLRQWLAAGVHRVIVGTKAVSDPDWFRSIAEQFPHRLLLGLDARDGLVATRGWLDTSTVSAIDLARRFDDLPLAGLVYTDIHRDGMLDGPNFEATRELAEQIRTPVIASGGVGSLADLTQLAALPIVACIVGRALYEGRFPLQAAIESARG